MARRFSSVYGGLVDFSGTFIQPGIIHFTRNNLLAIGRYPEGLDALAQSIAVDLEAAGFQTERSPCIMDLKWWKLVINTTNALLAIIDCWVQRAYSDPRIFPLVALLLEEGLIVLQTAGISPQSPSGTPPLEETIARLDSGRRGRHVELPFEDRTYPSTWQDLYLKRGSTEADLFNGEIIRLGKQGGVPTPLNSLLLEMIEIMTRNKEAPGKYTPEEMKELFKNAKAS
jgi:2-dehydropantoate 2-reductase